jgi:hypothetical protein
LLHSFLTSHLQADCGPYQNAKDPFDGLTNLIYSGPAWIISASSFLMSRIFVIPFVLVLLIIIYFDRVRLKKWRAKRNALAFALEQERADKQFLLKTLQDELGPRLVI